MKTANIKALLEYIHRGQKRKTGEKYTSHPYAVRAILRQSGLKDATILSAALLHDILEDTYITREYLQLRYGKQIATIVHLLSKEDAWNTQYCKMKSNIDQLEDAWQECPAIVLIKIADRIHNIMTIDGFLPEKRREYLRETEQMLLPFFRRVTRGNKLGRLHSCAEKLIMMLERETATASRQTNGIRPR